MIENQGLSYGLFHSIAQPVYSWGVVRKVMFPSVNMDIGHVRPIGWSKDNDRATWIAYNKLRGQYMSALEYAIPERFFNDPAQCNLEGCSTPNVALQPCPQGISGVKAIGLAAAQGQKIYTITKEVFANNPGIVSSQLFAHSRATQQAVQNALSICQEVTIHERPITQSGWTGAGYTTIDPETGAGGYMIDGGSNGGWMGVAAGLGAAIIVGALFFVSVAAVVASILIILYPGPIWASLLTGVVGILAGAGANAAGMDPIFAALFRFVIGAIIVGSVLAAYPLILPAILSLLLGTVLRSIALEITIILAVR